MTAAAFTRIPRLWPGETVVIVGGGPSLAGFDGRRLAGRRTIAVNNAWEVVPADVLWFSDSRWWRWNGAKVRAGFRGRVATRAHLPAEEQVAGLWHLGRTVLPAQPGGRGPLAGKERHEGIEMSPDAVRGTMGGHNAVNLAVHLAGPGARLVLLGFDGKPSEAGRYQFHDEHRVATVASVYPDRALPELRSTAEPLAALGIAVINATPSSAVDWWPTMSLEDALA